MILVKKYGGKTLSTPEKIKQVADNIAAQYKSGKKLIITVSAMGQTTDELIRLAHQVSHKPNRRELDMLLTTGERVSMALVSMALIERGCPAVSFTGSQAGIMTSGEFTHAKIVDLKPIRIQEALEQNKVVVLAGFQGVDPATKEITTLGRGGSDTTAIAMGAHFKASEVQILKDVAGIYTADPKIVPEARVLPEVNYDQLVEMCYWGAQFLHYDGAVMAREKQVPLFIGSAEEPTKGTRVIVNSQKKNGFSVNSYKLVNQDTVAAPSIKYKGDDFSAVTITQLGADQMKEEIVLHLAQKKIEVLFAQISAQSVTVGVKAAMREAAIQVCHQFATAKSV